MKTINSTVPEKVRELINGIEPESDVIIYGSHARGEASPDSDWDILIITERILSWDEEQNLRSVIYRYEVASDTVLSLVIHSKEEWDNPLFRLTPFYRNVNRDGIRI
jgi:uncharacterized protein